MRNRNLIALLLGLCLSLTMIFAQADETATVQAAEPNTVKITIVHTNDTHARVKEGDGMGFAKISSLIHKIKQENPNTLVLDAGDTFHGQTIATLNEGESITQIMNIIGYTAMAPGNHDFNYGYERLVELDGLTDFPILAANVKKADGADLFTPYVISEVAGLKVGIFGLATPETTYKTHPDNVKGIVFMDPIKAASEMTALLKDKTDILVCIAHLGMDAASADTSIKVAEAVEDIDLIIDGHSHTVLEQGQLVGKTMIASTGEYDKNLGTVEITVDAGKITDIKAKLITADEAAEATPDEAIVKAIEEIESKQAEILSEVVGKTEVDLQGARELVRKSETNLGNLITDAMVSLTGADCALTNGGGIRASIPAGNITKGNVIEVLPFGNYIVTKKVTGADIKAALEHGTSAYPELLGGFPHVSGITYVIDTARPVGDRVVDIRVKGKALDPNAFYTLATNDFMAAGGDNYTMFADNAIENEYSGLDEAVIIYIQAKGTIAPKAEGRITVVDGTPEEPQYYIVKKGDWLRKIARMFNTTWQKLAELNQLKNPDLIYPNQKILLP